MYSPGSTRPGAYPEDRQTGRTHRFHPLDNQQPRTPYPSFTTTGPPQELAVARVGVGVGVMLDSSGSSEFFQDSDPFDSTRNRTRRTRSSPTTSADLHLPPIKELSPKPPSHHHAVEPPVPPPRRSQRYLRDVVRTPDIVLGRDYAYRRRADDLTVSCDSCRKTWHVPKTCVLMKCPECKHVTSAMPAVVKGFSMKTDDYQRFTTPRK